jgi:hypothetical protein
MSQSQDTLTPQFELRVNGIADPRIRFRMSHDEPDDFDVLVDDAILGTLAITPDCLLELREAGADWRTVTLDELKGIVVGDNELLITEDFPKASDMAERRSLELFDEVEVIHGRSPHLADLTGHADCLKRVQALFYCAGLPHKSAGTVFVVPDLGLARSLLSRAGFYPSPISPAALVEPQTRCAVQLIEQRV